MEEIVLCSAFPSLESLYLNKLIALENIFHGTLMEGSFGKLKSITVIECGRLKSIFPFSIVKQLEEIEVSECKIMQEIVTCGNEHEAHSANNVADDVIVLPRLHSLVLQSLPNLIQFFQSESREGHLFVNASMPLFNGKVILANLEELTVDWDEVMSEIWHGESPAASFCKLKVLHLSCSRYKPVVFSLEHIYRLQNLENLCLSGVLLKEIYCHKGLGAGPAGIPICLSALKLSRLPNLLHLLTEEVQDKAFRNLRILDVTRCGRLKSLVPSSRSFQNLTALRVSECHALKNLLALSTARSLSQLTRLSITNCKGIIKIVANEGGDTNADIAFDKLKILALHHLPSLRRFCSGNCSLKFPCLEKVVVSQCPEMRSFSCGTIDSSKVNSIVVEIEKEWIWEQENIEWYFEYIEYDKPIQQLWEGDINATVHKLWEDHHPVTALQRLFTEANVQNYEEEACSSSFE